MSSFFGSDGSFVLQFAVIFAVILAVLTAGVLLVRRFSGGGGLSARPGQRARQPRLGIVDVYELDRARQLILLRRDNVEHLLLVGGPNDVVIERNIQRGQRLPPEPILRTEPAPEPVLEPAPDLIPEIEARRPEAPLFEERAPSFPMPAVVEAPVPGSTVPPPSRQPLSEADIPPEPRDEEEPAPVVQPAPPPAPEPQRRFLRRSTPALVNPKPDVASERVRSEPTFAIPRQAQPETVFAPPAPVRQTAPPPAAAPPTPAPPVSVPAARTVDAAILSDMARQLEIALSRPASAVTPPPGLSRPAQDPAPPAAEPEPVTVVETATVLPADPVAADPVPVAPITVDPVPVDPMAAAMAGARPRAPEPTRDEAEDALFEEIVPVEEISPPPAAAHPAPEPFLPEPPPVAEEVPAPAAQAEHPVPDAEPIRIEPTPAESEPVAPVLAPETPPPAPEVTAPEEAPPAPAPKPAPKPNPFSVEEIEAEFARLLGRPLEKRN